MLQFSDIARGSRPPAICKTEGNKSHCRPETAVDTCILSTVRSQTRLNELNFLQAAIKVLSSA